MREVSSSFCQLKPFILSRFTRDCIFSWLCLVWRDEDETGGSDITPGQLLILTPCLPLPLLSDAWGVERGVQWKECIKDFWRFFSQHRSIFRFILFYFLMTIVLFSSSSLQSLNWIAMNRSACSHDCISVYFYSREAISSATFTFSCSFLVDFPFTATGNLISLWFVMKRGRGTNCFSAGSKRSWRRSCQCERRWKVEEEEVEVLVSQDANDLQDVIERSFRSFPSIHLLYVKRYSPVPVSGVLLCKSLQYFRERLTWCWSSYTLISVYDSKERVENERQREADDCTNIEGRITCYCREWDKSERKLQEGKK